MKLDTLFRDTTLPRNEILQLAESITGRDRTALIAHADAALPADAWRVLRDLIGRRTAGEPIAYLVGHREFYGRRFAVDRRVLIPRPETELLVDLALAWLDGAPPPSDGRAARVLDAGTGSGAIAVTLALERPMLAVLASDASPDALAVAARNATMLGARIDTLHSDWYATVEGRFDLIVSNPPYVAAGDRHLLEGDLRFEPRHALTDERDGLEAIRALVRGAARHLQPGGALMIEHGHDQATAVRRLLIAAGFADVNSARDLAGIERVAFGTFENDASASSRPPKPDL